MDLDILFLGRLFPREKEAEIKKKMKTGMQDAANALQWNIIDGLDANDCGSVKILSYLPIDSYPRGYADRRIEPYVFQHTEKYRSDDLVVGCTNLTIVKQFANLVPFKKQVKAWLQQKDGRKKVLMLYTAMPMFLQLAKYAKRLDPLVTICCVIADLPEFATASDLHGIKALYNRYQVAQCQRLYGNVDRFVLLTDQMAKKLGIRVPYMVMEGIAPEKKTEEDTTLAEKYKDEKYILYTGTLNYKFGIGELLDAFAQIKDPQLRLMICGFGQAEARIREEMARDPRIIFLGRVDRKQILPLQRGATVLVNPRQNNEEFTKYSFPSKTMEYLAAGVPVVAYKLDGIPNEYDGYLHYVQDDSIDSLAAKLQEICGLDAAERENIGRRGAEFVLQNKNPRVQARRILEFLA